MAAQNREISEVGNLEGGVEKFCPNRKIFNFFQKYFADTKICTIFAPANEKFRFGKLRYIAGWSSW